MLNESIRNKQEKLAVIGLGYVGLPIALAFARKVSVIAFDINTERIALMQQGIDPSRQLDKKDFEQCDIVFTDSLNELRKAKFFIVAVPTPVNEQNIPDLSFVLAASATVGKVIKKGDYVVYESTVYPGCTEEDCLPVIEQLSGLKNTTDFQLGYSPERINPGDKVHTLENVMKVVAASNEESLNIIADVYAMVVEAGIYKAPSIKVAEAAKIIENTQRDLNIGLMNELSIICDKMNINTYDVLETAGTKWNFLKFSPGLVGGHCIGVDPYYLTYKANHLGYTSKIITAGRFINDSMSKYVAEKVLQHVLANTDNIRLAKILIMGVTFKENVTDIRNSKVVDVINTLKKYSLHIEVTDTCADITELKQEYGFGLVEKIADNYDAVIIAVPHKEYVELDDAFFSSITKPHALIADLKGLYRKKIVSRKYWSL
ncbi:MAG: nucleotide sugar dehydrogenase [Sphingobacteriia bacterium]|nr:nucleotide sugar dehydrogenase [Sphingobacteriia bacterium]